MYNVSIAFIVCRQPLELCKEELRQLIDNVSRKRKNKTVIMSQIPKRYDEPTLNK